MEEQIKQAVTVLNNGGIVIFPTDTAFGIGCRINDEEAVERLFKIRNRPKDKAVPVLVDSIRMAEEYVGLIDEKIERLMNKYWPGGLTLILRCIRVKVPSLVRGGGDTLGVRMPDHKTTLSIISGVGVPILGPSANFAGEKTPYIFSDLDPRLVEKVDFVVHGETKLKKASTVLDCTHKPWVVLRQGAVRVEL